MKLQSACFEKLIFSRAFNVRKTKGIAKFDGLEPRRCEDIKGIVAPSMSPKRFGTFEKQAPVFRTIQGERIFLQMSTRICLNLLQTGKFDEMLQYRMQRILWKLGQGKSCNSLSGDIINYIFLFLV